MRYLPVSLFDTPAVALWLEEQSAAGRHLKKFRGETCASFQTGAPVRCRYYLEPQLRRPDAPDPETLAAYAEAGWEYVCGTTWNEFYVWRSTRPDAADLHTDPVAEGLGYDFIAGAMRRRWALLGLLLGIPLALLAGAVLYSGRLLLPLVRSDSLAQPLLLVFLMAYLGWITADDLAALRRVRRRLLAGVPLDREPSPRRQRRRWGEWGYRAVLLVLLAASLVPPAALKSGEEDPVWAGPLPCLDARELGAAYTERAEPLYQYRVTPLGRDLLVMMQGEAHMSGGFSTLYFDTETCFCRLRFGPLARPVLGELVHSRLERHADLEPRRLEDQRFDEAWYGAGDGVQFFAARRGDCVLSMRTDAPEDLRGHLDDLEALFTEFERGRETP